MEKKIVYHVDRRLLFIDKKIGDLIEICSVKNSYHSNLLIGDKISVHGDHYMNKLGVGINDDSSRFSVYWELFLEMVRLHSFPKVKSRYHAMFGFERVHDIIDFTQKWIETTQTPANQLYVYELEVYDYIQRDMNITTNTELPKEESPNTYIDNQLIRGAYDYWSGKLSNKPLIETVIYNTAKITNIIEFSKLQHMK